ncbi:Cilia- and flagella-associated protein 20 [Pseudolycoriella hygida]|uniref:Cilia- and flagella-associated protein 20 n=1 Tax=Pseudolycoriella hygida TaxID=35572 RepID=A0A9Q0RYD5_9DIPT|nr:Cilia- and flagella-associated protein 20 [Pseudolycoriella hygida]
MFRNTFQKGLLSIFYSIGSSPLLIWKTQTKNGHIKRVTDEDLNSLALEIIGSNVATAYITTPIQPTASLAIKLPFIVLIVKNMQKSFSFEVQVLDDQNVLRRFRVSNCHSSTKINNFSTAMPIALSSGWNQIQFNLADFTRRAYNTSYVETVRVQINANIRIRRIFFSDR